MLALVIVGLLGLLAAAALFLAVANRLGWPLGQRWVEREERKRRRYRSRQPWD
jgi:hypothetical protein